MALADSGAVVPGRPPANSRHSLSTDRFVPAHAGRAATEDRPTVVLGL